MPWKEVTEMSLKEEFVRLAFTANQTFTSLCEQFNLSTKTGYKWLNRYKQEGPKGLIEHSRRPHSHPDKVDSEIEKKIVAIRNRKQAWGGRKIKKVLENQAEKNIPAASTISKVLSRHHLIQLHSKKKQTVFKKFEHVAPNDLWQVDFKGHFAMREG